MRRVLAATLFAAIAACTPRGEGVVVVPDPPPRDGHEHASGDEAPALPPPVGRSPSDAETRALHSLTRAAERIRGLRFAHEVPVRIQSSEEITAFVASRIDEHELEHARVFYVAIGLLPADLDVRAMLLGVMGEQIVGFYDPDSGTLVIRDDVVRELRAMESAGRQVTDAASAIVIVHELVHALQDQRLGLGEQFHFAPGHRERTGDEANAFASLVEGDATLAMIGWLATRSGGHLSDLTASPERLRALVEGSDMSGGGPALASAPAIVRAPLLSRYFDGMLFCATLHARGGFPIVDAAHRDPPTTSEQVLHPGAYFAHDAPTTRARPWRSRPCPRSRRSASWPTTRTRSASSSSASGSRSARAPTATPPRGPAGTATASASTDARTAPPPPSGGRSGTTRPRPPRPSAPPPAPPPPRRPRPCAAPGEPSPSTSARRSPPAPTWTRPSMRSPRPSPPPDPPGESPAKTVGCA